ncbi:sulfurtransferase [Asticcacaulis sp. BYS171W]|uniref:Sulfurtransferase n=1 Tax=Asticcacaulis aquaticus TaxID=2984212 RepID=A0ABT5HNZ1_9CAUL|nr:sulfurtransferase [Asticcacaulis aquaticus]MDC7681780.1 sulfurtransferase [Asticcacaulis aquaticus]
MSAQIDVATLKALLDDHTVKIIDGSWALDGTDMQALYIQDHIPTAQFFDIDAISDTSSDLPHMAPTADVFARAVGSMGISERDHVVIYDRQGLFSAARVWWTFRLMGHEKVQILRGGLPAWIAASYPVQSGTEWVKSIGYTPHKNEKLSIDINELKSYSDMTHKLVLDARPAARFDGTMAEPRAGLRSGYMPGSRNLPAADLIEGGALKPVPVLKNVFSALHVTPDTEVVTTCGSGVTAAIIALALFEAGHESTRLFDGSWAQWGREDQDTVVVKI